MVVQLAKVTYSFVLSTDSPGVLQGRSSSDVTSGGPILGGVPAEDCVREVRPVCCVRRTPSHPEGAWRIIVVEVLG